MIASSYLINDRFKKMCRVFLKIKKNIAKNWYLDKNIKSF